MIRFRAFMLAAVSLSLLPIILQATSPTDLFPPQKSGCQWCCHCAATTASPFCMPMMTLSNWHHYTWLGIWLCLNWLCSNLEQLCVNIELGVRFLLSVPLKQTCPETATVPVLVCFTEGDNGTSKHVKKKNQSVQSCHWRQCCGPAATWILPLSLIWLDFNHLQCTIMCNGQGPS